MSQYVTWNNALLVLAAFVALRFMLGRISAYQNQMVAEVRRQIDEHRLRKHAEEQLRLKRAAREERNAVEQRRRELREKRRAAQQNAPSDAAESPATADSAADNSVTTQTAE